MSRNLVSVVVVTLLAFASLWVQAIVGGELLPDQTLAVWCMILWGLWE